MKTGDWLLIVLLVILTTSVLSTGSLAVYLTLNRQQEERAAPLAAPTAQPAKQGAPATQAPVAADAETETEPRIAFVSDRDGDTAIYTVDADGSQLQQVSAPGPGFCVYPSWSPDGRRVAYVRAEELTDDDGVVRDVWISEADGSEHIHVTPRISTTVFLQPAWSPDGMRLAFIADDTTSEGHDPARLLHIARADGSGIERSTPISWTAIHQIAWSPVEDEILLVTGDPSAGQAGVHVMSLDGSQVVEIYQSALTADWSPDGKSIAVGDYTSSEVLVIDAGDGEEWKEARSIVQTAMQPAEIAWSPSGTHLAVATTRNHRQGYATNLDVVTLATGDVTVATEGQGWVGWPTWSPDGERVLFTLGELTRGPGLSSADLWIYDLTSNQSEPLTFGEGFDGNGAWSP